MGMSDDGNEIFVFSSVAMGVVLYLFNTNRVSREDKAIGIVCLSVRFHSIC